MRRYIEKMFFLLIALALCHNIAAIDASDMQMRCDLLESFACQYRRPFTSIEIAVCDGAGSIYLAEKYKQAVCVMVENDEPAGAAWAGLLCSYCKEKNLSNVILLGNSVRAHEIRRLGECEHFDIVFSFYIFERIGEAWQDIVEAMAKLGNHLLLEIPDSRVQAQQYLLKKGAHTVAILGKSKIYYLFCDKKGLKRKTWLRTLESTIMIDSTFTKKKLIKKTPCHDVMLTSDWEPGINLVTFKMYRGIYPTIPMVKKALSDIRYVRHNDWAMHNIIIQGTGLKLIDFGDPRMLGKEQSRSRMRDEIYRKVVHCLEIIEPQEVKAFFWECLKTKPRVHGVKKLGLYVIEKCEKLFPGRFFR